MIRRFKLLVLAAAVSASTPDASGFDSYGVPGVVAGPIHGAIRDGSPDAALARPSWVRRDGPRWSRPSIDVFGSILGTSGFVPLT